MNNEKAGHVLFILNKVNVITVGGHPHINGQCYHPREGATTNALRAMDRIYKYQTVPRELHGTFWKLFNH